MASVRAEPTDAMQKRRTHARTHDYGLLMIRCPPSVDCVGIFKVGRVPSCPGSAVSHHILHLDAFSLFQDSLLQARRSVIFSSVTSLSFSSRRPCGTISMKSTPAACCNTQHKLPAFRCDLALRLGLVGHARAHPRGSTIHPPLFRFTTAVFGRGRRRRGRGTFQA